MIKNAFFILILNIFPIYSWSRTSVALATAPEGHRWISIVQGEKFLFKLENSSIEFSFANEGRILQSKDFDEQNKIISVKPARTLWQAHPDNLLSTEQIYLNILRELGYENLTVPYVKTTADGSITLSQMQDFLDIALKQKVNLTYSTFKKQIENRVELSRKQLITKFLHLNISSLNNLAGLFDVVEPIFVDGVGYHAFALTPIKTLEDSQLNFLNWLENLTRLTTFNPMQVHLFDRSISNDYKDALIALLTHNHYTEQLFVKAVVLKLGPIEGWRALQSINKLYELERKLWEQAQLPFVVSYDENLYSTFGNSQISFINNQIPLLVEPIFIVNSCNVDLLDTLRQKKSTIVPQVKTYHLYGSYLVSSRLKRMHLPASLVELASVFLGKFYKTSKDSYKAYDLEIIKRVYRQGAIYANQCH